MKASPIGAKEPSFLNSPFLRSLTRRGKCPIFTTEKPNPPRLHIDPHQYDWRNPRLKRGLRERLCRLAPNPVTGLCTACTRLKIQVLTNTYFSLTENVEGVQQDRSL